MSGFSRVDMNVVAPLIPADRKAALVAGKGEHFDFTPAGNQLHSDLPIEWREPTAQELQAPCFVNLTGQKTGRLTIMGIEADNSSASGLRWVVRCVCGNYQAQRSKYLKRCLAGQNPGEYDPMCLWCQKTQKLKQGIGKHRSGPLIQVEGYR